MRGGGVRVFCLQFKIMVRGACQRRGQTNTLSHVKLHLNEYHSRHVINARDMWAIIGNCTEEVGVGLVLSQPNHEDNKQCRKVVQHWSCLPDTVYSPPPKANVSSLADISEVTSPFVLHSFQTPEKSADHTTLFRPRGFSNSTAI